MDDTLRDQVAQGRYEVTDEGIYIPKCRILAKGVFRYSKRGEPEEVAENMVVDEGLTYMLRTSVGLRSAISNWYIALFSGSVTVLPSWVAATWAGAGVANEWTDYDEATRQAWSRAEVADLATDNFDTKATFTSSSDGQTVRGAALISSSAAGSDGAGAVLMAAARFPSDKPLDTGEMLDVGYGLTLTAV